MRLNCISPSSLYHLLCISPYDTHIRTHTSVYTHNPHSARPPPCLISPCERSKTTHSFPETDSQGEIRWKWQHFTSSIHLKNHPLYKIIDVIIRIWSHTLCSPYFSSPCPPAFVSQRSFITQSAGACAHWRRQVSSRLFRLLKVKVRKHVLLSLLLSNEVYKGNIKGVSA